MSLLQQMTDLARRAKLASRQLADLSTAEKNQALQGMAAALEACSPALQKANVRDLEGGRQMGLNAAMLERLMLDNKRILAMAQAVRDIADLPDPVGRILDDRTRPNGLRLQKVSTPIGVVVIIYESRPNVTADAASLCLKSGNATILRGGKEAMHSNQLIAATMVDAGRSALGDRFPASAIQVVATPDREAIPALLSLTQYVDVCMPRGGEGLIRTVTDCSKVPVIKHFKGICHVFVDRDADPAMAASIVMNAKTQRPSVCNAAETLLIDQTVAARWLPDIAAQLATRHVELRTDPVALALLRSRTGPFPLILRPATEQDYYTEYNDMILNVRVVENATAAIDHINQYGSGHSDTIVTGNEATARRFLAAVDSAAVYWNASTRFTDGGEYGMGAEIGISTDKIGARGPMGLEELCSYKWLGFGTGQIRT